MTEEPARPHAKREVMPGIEHRQHKGLNNRAENSPPADTPTRAANEAVQIGRPETRKAITPAATNQRGLRRRIRIGLCVTISIWRHDGASLRNRSSYSSKLITAPAERHRVRHRSARDRRGAGENLVAGDGQGWYGILSPFSP